MVPLTEIEKIINDSGNRNFRKNQGAWGAYEMLCSEITGCGWKMGMCKSSSGKDNAINRMYTTGVIRSYPQNLIQCLFVDAFVEEISDVYKEEFGVKMRCSPILIIVTEIGGTWRAERILVQHKHPLLPLSKGQISEMFPQSELKLAHTDPFEITEGWVDFESDSECWHHNWGKISIFKTISDDTGISTVVEQRCRKPGCDRQRFGRFRGSIEWSIVGLNGNS